MSGAFGTPFWGRRDCRVPSILPFERAMVVSYTLSIVTIALSLTIRPHFAIECLQCSNQQIKILECSLWSRSVMFGLQRANTPG